VVAQKELVTGGLGARRVVAKVPTVVGKRKTVVVVVAAAARVGG